LSCTRNRIFGGRFSEEADCLLDLINEQVTRTQVYYCKAAPFARVEPQALFNIRNCGFRFARKFEQLPNMTDSI
jgi:hypothetical protein